jgi:hypothetical protein
MVFIYIKWIVFIAFSLLTILGILNFELWDQVDVLNSSGSSIGELWGHPHFLRYILVLPFFEGSQYMGMDYNRLFTLSIPILLYLIQRYTILSIEVIWIKYHSILRLGLHQFLVMFLLVSVVSLMNGRIIFSILGSAILLYSFVNWENLGVRKLLFYILIAFFLCSVSSGTFTIAILLAVVFVLYKLFKNKNKKEFFIFVPFLMLFLAILPILMVLIKKNVDYFGGGFDGSIAMLHHGLGQYFLSVEPVTLIMLLMILSISFWFVLILISAFKRISIPIWIVLVSIMGGAFGFSTMMIFIPALIVLFVSATFSFLRRRGAYA